LEHPAALRTGGVFLIQPSGGMMQILAGLSTSIFIQPLAFFSRQNQLQTDMANDNEIGRLVHFGAR
jgi:hypothetical protein